MKIFKSCEKCKSHFQTVSSEIRRGRGRFCCRICANLHMADNRRKPGWREIWKAKHKDDPNYILKVKARHLVEQALKYGRLLRNPCEICGEKKSEAHHDDYTKPLLVRFLCRTHHMRLHRS